MLLPPPNVSNAKNYLTGNSWPDGLQELLLKSCLSYPLRFFIIDNSGSMMTSDGERSIMQGKRRRYETYFKTIQCLHTHLFYKVS